MSTLAATAWQFYWPFIRADSQRNPLARRLLISGTLNGSDGDDAAKLNEIQF